MTALVSQNGNGDVEGLRAGWVDLRTAWAAPTAANREALRRFNTFDMTNWQSTEGITDASLIAPETWQLAYAATERIGVLIFDVIYAYMANRRYRDRCEPRVCIGHPQSERPAMGTTIRKTVGSSPMSAMKSVPI